MELQPAGENAAMKVLTTAGEINAELIRLIRGCASCRLAVAWASVGFEAFDLLMAKAQKVGKAIVGTHFYQTHPAFMEACLGNERVRFVLNPEGVFHPKVYLFEKLDGSWECVIGSATFTQVSDRKGPPFKSPGALELYPLGAASRPFRHEPPILPPQPSLRLPHLLHSPLEANAHHRQRPVR